MLAAEQIPFTIQAAEQHAEQMVFDVVGLSEFLTDLNEGGIARALLEAFAIQHEQLDSKVFYGIQRAIPVSLYTAFNFPRLGASKASGVVTFNRVAGSTPTVDIPVGTVLLAPATPAKPQVQFVVTTAVTMLSNQNYVDVPVAALVPGTSSNVGAGRISILAAAIANIDNIINYAGIRNGAEQESEEERAVRFLKYVTSLQRATLQGIESGALTAQLLDVDGSIIERVQKVVAIEPGNTLGRVNVYIDNGGGTATDNLVTETQRIIDGYIDANGARVAGYKAAGVVALVQKIVSTTIAITTKIKIEAGYDFNLVKVDVEDSIEAFFQQMTAGTPLILVDLLSTIATVPGVADLTLVTPTANLNAEQSQRILAGMITITQAI